MSDPVTEMKGAMQSAIGSRHAAAEILEDVAAAVVSGSWPVEITPEEFGRAVGLAMRCRHAPLGALPAFLAGYFEELRDRHQDL